jgi:hypothetical protein
MGKDELPSWLVEDAVARRYGCTPAEVRGMPYEDVNRALIIIGAEQAAEKTKSKRANRQ